MIKNFMLIWLLLLFSCQIEYKNTEDILPPAVKTGNIDLNTKKVTGEIISSSDGIVSYGHVWSKQNNPSLNDNRTNLGSTNSSGSFSSQLVNLEIGEIYYVAAYVEGNLGNVFYGEVIEFEAVSDLVSLNTGDFDKNEDHVTGTINGVITEIGSNTIIEYGHCWAIISPPTISNNRTNLGTLQGLVPVEFISEITNYELGKEIYIRAYAKNDLGQIFYGDEVSFSVSDVWIPLSFVGNSPSARRSASVFVIGQEAYLVGGFDGNAILSSYWRYDKLTNSWTRNPFGNSPSNPLATQEAVAFTIGNKGYFGTGWSSSATSSTEADTQFYSYNPETFLNPWGYPAALPIDYGIAASVGFSIGNKGYLCTGNDGFNKGLDFLWEFSPDSSRGSWIEKTSIEGRRLDAMGMAIGDRGYVGFGANPRGFVFYNDWREYNPQTDSWRLMASFPGATRAFGVTFTIDSLGFITLGRDFGFNPTVELWAFNPKNGPSGTWIRKSDFPGMGRYDAVAFVIDGKAYVGTGHFDDMYFNDWWMYVP